MLRQEPNSFNNYLCHLPLLGSLGTHVRVPQVTIQLSHLLSCGSAYSRRHILICYCVCGVWEDEGQIEAVFCWIWTRDKRRTIVFWKGQSCAGRRWVLVLGLYSTAGSKTSPSQADGHPDLGLNSNLTPPKCESSKPLSCCHQLLLPLTYCKFHRQLQWHTVLSSNTASEGRERQTCCSTFSILLTPRRHDYIPHDIPIYIIMIYQIT